MPTPASFHLDWFYSTRRSLSLSQSLAALFQCICDSGAQHSMGISTPGANFCFPAKDLQSSSVCAMVTELLLDREAQIEVLIC